MKGQFWPVHDSFFTSPGARTEAEFIRRATRAGVSEEDLAACKDSEEALARVKADQALAGKLQLQSTPAFLIGTISGRDVKVRKIVVGARPKAEFEAVLNSVLGADKGRPKAP
jgi:protein-disulfide isomerase